LAGAERKRREKRRREEAVDWLLRNKELPEGTERPEFNEWLGADPLNRRAYEKAEALMGDARAAILSDPALAEYTRRRPGHAAKVAGAAVLLTGLVGSFFLLDGPMRLRADMIAARGELPIVRLSDGSVMQLNADSAVAYEFSSGSRIVRLLRGEAFFEVAPDPPRPFAVEAGEGRTVALGTAFNVRLDRDDRTIVTVTDHAVRVSVGNSTLEINAGQEAAYTEDGELQPPRPADTGTALAWRKGLLVVDNARLADVVAEISRYYGGKIFLVGFGLGERRVSGTFRISDPEAALAVLQRTLDLSVTQMGPVAIIR
jgi:transmembrane sensor